MVAYAILETPGKGKALKANQYIARGSLIIAKAPLLTVSVGTYELYDDQAYFEPGERSGGPGIYRQFLKLPRKMQSAYNSLHYITKSDEELEAAKGGRKNALTREEWECLSRLRKNSFDGRVDFDSPAEVMQHVVFNHISRINHSCTPNAVWKWDPDLGQGVVHALREVLKHEEITISYLQDPENILLSRDQRREYIRTNFEFECGCDCCKSHETAKDDEARHTASLAYNYLLLLTGAEGVAVIPNPPLPVLRHRKICRADSGHNYHLRMKHVLEQTIALFKQANIADTNLSALYNLQATYYENLFATTDGSVNEQACHKCGLLLHRREYLDLALRALDDVIHNDTICFGAGHREVRMVTQRRLELQKRRAGCNSPRLS